MSVLLSFSYAKVKTLFMMMNTKKAISLFISISICLVRCKDNIFCYNILIYNI